MAARYGATTLRCDMCRTDFSSPLQMAFHVLRVQKHRRMLSHFAPQQVKELARLQYFLDTHMSKEPILGLEYIVEEQLEPEKYRYTCQLCHHGGDPYTAFVHIMSKEHMERYIEKHHPSLLVNNDSQPIAALSLRELRAKALNIQNQYGRKEMQWKRSAGNSPAKQVQHSPEQQQAPPEQQQAPPEQQQAPPEQQQASLKKKKKKKKKKAASPMQKKASPLPVTQKKLPHKCPICNLYFDSALTLCQHVLGKGHQEMLSKVAPGDVKKLDRMQYILDTYIEADAVLGLEYVVERQESESYRYFCRLCRFEGGVFSSLTHVFEDDHMERYIKKHYSLMLPSQSTERAKRNFARRLKDSAFTILRTYGSKNVQTEDRFLSDPSLLETARPSHTEEVRPSPTEEVRPSPPKNVSEISGPFLHDEELGSCRPCRLCNAVFASPVALWKHVMGSNHKEILSKTSPKELREVGRLQYFLNNHMKEDPLLGLEYIVEAQVGYTSYKYTCQLCNVIGYLPQMITHISCVDHIERYIDKDHSDLSLRVYTYPDRADYIKALTKIVRIILDKCGRQDVLKCK